MTPATRLRTLSTVAALLLGALEATASDLTERLGEEWRWREHDVDADGFHPRSVIPFDAESAILLSERRMARFDGRRLTIPEGWKFERPLGEAARLPGGIVARLRGALAFVTGDGVRWIEEGAGEQSLNHLVVRRDGTAAVCDGDRILEVDGGGRRTFRAGPSPGSQLVALGEDEDGRLWTVSEDGVYREGSDGWAAIPIDADVQVHTLGRILSAGPRMHFLPISEQRDLRGLTWDGVRLSAFDVREVDVGAEPAVVGSEVVTTNWTGELLVFDGVSWSRTAPNLLRGGRVRSLAWLDSGRLMAVTARGRVLSCDVRSERWVERSPGDTGPWSIVNAITPHPDGGLWVGTSAGLARYRRGEFEIVADRIADVQLQSITALATDDTGALWIGSGSGFRGVVRLDADGLTLHREPEGVDDGFVHAARRGHDGTMWFALLDNYRHPERSGGLASLKDGVWRRFGTDDGLPIERCYDVLHTERRTVVGTALSAAMRIGETWTDFGGEGHQRTFRLFETGDGTLWSGPGTANVGISKLTRGRFVRQTGSGFARISAADFAETSDRRLWISGDHGLAVIDREGEIHAIGSEPGAPSVRFWPMIADADDTLWIGSLGHGLLRYRPDDVDAPEMNDIELRPSPTGTMARFHGRDLWDVTPPDQLRYRLRVGDGPWSDVFDGPEVDLPAIEDTVTVTAVATDLAGNTSPERAIEFRVPPNPTAAARTAAALTITALVLLAFTLQFRRIRERHEARERARRRLLESEQRYRSMVESADVVLSSYDTAGRATYLSPRLAEICGVPAESLSAGTLASRVHRDDVSALAAQADLRARGESDRHGVEFRLRDAAGGWRWFWQVQSARRDENDEVIGFDTVALDITERRRLQEALQNTQRLDSLGVMAGGVAHDFNNLLVAVIGNAELLRRELADEPGRLKLVDRIERAGREAGTLCRRMLAYAGRAQLDYTTVDPNELVAETVEILRGTLPTGVSLVLVPGPRVWIDGDVAQLKQIVLNLILNAAEAIGDRGGRIVVRVIAGDTGDRLSRRLAVDHFVASAKAIIIEVKDDGPGVDDEVVGRIFDPFFSTKFEGRGLGLAAVAGIVKAHRGAIEVDSTRDRGSTFRIWLPAAATTDLPREAAESAPAPIEGRVLLVDDDPMVIGVAQAMLEEFGLDTVIADGGDRALETWRADRDRIDLVLLDVTMPKRDGVDVMREMREIDPTVRVILTTGYAREETDRRCADAPPDGFLSKPYSSSELERELRKVLDKSNASRGTG